MHFAIANIIFFTGAKKNPRQDNVASFPKQ